MSKPVEVRCWKCGVEMKELPRKISFRALCEQCHAWLHCCKNCVNYRPGLPNDCAVPGTDYIADREASNFCEEFGLLGRGPAATANPEEVAKRLFGEDIEDKPKSQNSFKDLFSDD